MCHVVYYLIHESLEEDDPLNLSLEGLFEDKRDGLEGWGVLLLVDFKSRVIR